MSERGTRERIPAALREQLALGELSEARRQALREEFGEQALAEAQAEIEASDEALRPRLTDAEVFARRVAVRAEARRPRRTHPAVWAAPMLAAAVALVVVWRAEPGSDLQGGFRASDEPGPTERIKGLEPALRVYRKRGGEVEALESGAQVREHDLVQLGYVAAGQRYGVIFSLDGHGVVTLHLPAAGQPPAVLEPSGEGLLPDAYELDDAPDYERFFFVTAAHRFDVERVLEAAATLSSQPQAARHGRLELDSSLQQASFLLRKEGP